MSGGRHYGGNGRMAATCLVGTRLELREYYYDTACAFRKTRVVDGNRLKYKGFEALLLSVNS